MTEGNERTTAYYCALAIRDTFDNLLFHEEKKTKNIRMLRKINWPGYEPEREESEVVQEELLLVIRTLSSHKLKFYIGLAPTTF